MDLRAKLSRLEEIIKEQAPILIAYSGGVDSTLLAAVSQETLGSEKVYCVLVDGSEVPRRGVAEAISYASTLGLNLEILKGESLSQDLKQINPSDRCRHCKTGTYTTLAEAATRHGCKSIADGANISDLGEHRPGIDAFSSCGVIHPFIMAEITKQDIREIAHQKGLPFWDKPSSACLYSRIPYGDEITDKKLQMIEESEEILKNFGFNQVRVRHHGNIARIEVLPDDMVKIFGLREEIEKNIRNIGFSYVALDLRGYRSGSMDEVLPIK
ncbi:MAG TPA: ATP-dependent sacrificial sulfur transferase LarE [Methanospirillum sp.]|uniref:ATP-dependent sacrificial sulfur transferase LarE n=1 Tax=Methanospirillum sp. TaxID=45200 RepID=UPI002CB2EA5A|nr:ATP-dependent sacrificial sulfur transferase LarE [Methanospirillum sp.]HWQ64190.1 ATP-dependent sacrificial sulfur transferase LarE [Methanospirillum sp.]